ncbi:hypothetical protein SAMN05444161_3115 [Rhizobiales bacterium GAS191]|nr:hypothetical protein SAMN05444161_3115 [Rhizobiales bacterium GAS191]
MIDVVARVTNAIEFGLEIALREWRGATYEQRREYAPVGLNEFSNMHQITTLNELKSVGKIWR